MRELDLQITLDIPIFYPKLQFDTSCIILHVIKCYLIIISSSFYSIMIKCFELNNSVLK